MIARINRKFRRQFVERFMEHGIIIPEKATLLYTGLDDNRAGACDAPAEEWAIGFGLMTKPWEYPPIHQSFRKAARWHTWAWAAS